MRDIKLNLCSLETLINLVSRFRFPFKGHEQAMYSKKKYLIHIIPAAILLWLPVFCNPVYAQSLIKLNWGKTISGVDTYKISTDKYGNTYSLGQFFGVVDFLG